MNAIRVDLTDPDVQLFTTPRATNYSLNYIETSGLSVSNFLTHYKVQVAVNANNFHNPGTTDGPSYLLPPWSPLDLGGLSISRGEIVSTQVSSVDSASMMFTTNNHAAILHTNWPAHSTDGIYTAVSGLYAILAAGVNIGSNYTGSSGVHDIQPRTVYGLSADRQYLYLVTIDGRQGGYSDGALDWESAAWLLRLGAWDGVNMDGGGSTCLVMADSTGQPISLNRDNASAAPTIGRERLVGSHLGIFAKPIPGIINDVITLPDDTAATITWTTIAPATSQVRYGLTTNFDSVSSYSSAPVTNHAVLLNGLNPNTGYYFQVVSTIGVNEYTSSNFYFLTTNYVTTGQIFDLTNAWTYTTANLDGVNWTASGYTDSGWSEPAMGLLWTDDRGPNPEIPVPLNSEMPLNPNTGDPFLTYYFRTHFNFTNNPAGASLIFTDYIDDGAVFYLNGVELYRLRMPGLPAIIERSTLSDGYACSGDATCPDQFSVGNALTNVLVQGDNVLAVEVHNYNAGSPDITFGVALDYSVPYTLKPELRITASGGTVNLSWDRGGFILQQADSHTGPWNDVTGPVFCSPFSQEVSTSTRFFRLRK